MTTHDEALLALVLSIIALLGVVLLLIRRLP